METGKFILPDGTERPFDGPVPRPGERVELDSFAQFEAGKFLVVQLDFETVMFRNWAVVVLAKRSDPYG